jgi:hypothetical protein
LQSFGTVNGKNAVVLLRGNAGTAAAQGTVLAGSKGLPAIRGYERMSNDYDGIQFSDRPSWEHTLKELFIILGKRLLSLPSKMIGFKPFCLYLATWLLIKGLIRDWIWFAVCVIVLFGIVGLKVIASWKGEQ